MSAEEHRIKPLVKKMGRKEIEDLCDRKGWTLIDFETASEFVDSIPHNIFWVDGYSIDEYAEKEGELRPNVAFKKDGELFLTTCHPNWLQNCVVLRKKQTVMSTYKDIISLIEKAHHIDGITRSEISALSRMEIMLHELIGAREKYERQESDSD